MGSRAQPRPVKHLRTLRPAPGAPARRLNPKPHRVWDERARRECPSRTAARRARRSRGAAPATVHSATAHRAGADAPSHTGAKPSCPRTANAGRACWAIFCGRTGPRPAAPLRTRAGVCTWRRPEEVGCPLRARAVFPTFLNFTPPLQTQRFEFFRGKAAVSFSETDFDASVNCVRNNLNFSLNLYLHM